MYPPQSISERRGFQNSPRDFKEERKQTSTQVLAAQAYQRKVEEKKSEEKSINFEHQFKSLFE